MTFTQETLQRIEGSGLILSRDSDEIVIKGNRQALTPERREWMKSHKQEILTALQAREDARQASAASDAQEAPAEVSEADSGGSSCAPLPRQSIEQYTPGTIDSMVMAADIETTGLDPRNSVLVMVSWTDDAGAYSAEPKNAAGFFQKMADPSILKVFHNAAFDVHFLSHQGYPVRNYADTMLMAQVLTNNAGKHGLDACCALYLGVELDKSLQGPGNWRGFLMAEHFEYSRRDAVYTMALYRVLDDLLREKNLYGVYLRELRALPAILHLQKDGMPFDAAAWRSDLAGHRASRDAMSQEICRDLGGVVNLASPPQLMKCLHARGIHVESTGDDILAEVEEQDPIITKIRKWKRVEKLCNLYGDKLLKMVTGGRIHSSWRLIGAASGRMTCSKPNLQQVPRVMRGYFKPAPGYKFVIADYSQIELRILAEIADEKIMLEAYQNGEDLHVKTAQ